MSDAEITRPQRSPFRRAYNSGTWHFAEQCPAWPLHNFVESDKPEFTRLCRSCHEILTRGFADGT